MIPGTSAVAVAWLVAKLYSGSTKGVSFTTDALLADQVNGPTEVVISVPWLKAWASSVMDWLCDRQGSWMGSPLGRMPVTEMLSMAGCTNT